MGVEFGGDGFSDFFDTFFSGIGRRQTATDLPRRGHDLEGSIDLSLRDAYAGGTKSVSMQLDDVCPSCGGTGVKQRRICPTCHGTSSRRRRWKCVSRPVCAKDNAFGSSVKADTGSTAVRRRTNSSCGSRGRGCRVCKAVMATNTYASSLVCRSVWENANANSSVS